MNRKGRATRPAPATITAVSSRTSPPPLIIAFQLACSSAANRTAKEIERLKARRSIVVAGDDQGGRMPPGDIVPATVRRTARADAGQLHSIKAVGNRRGTLPVCDASGRDHERQTYRLSVRGPASGGSRGHGRRTESRRRQPRRPRETARVHPGDRESRANDDERVRGAVGAVVRPRDAPPGQGREDRRCPGARSTFTTCRS